jgi:ankyrin repeat protein
MHIVGVCGIPELLDILISYNVDINAQDKDGFTPLHLAYMYKEMDTIKKLIERGAKEDIRAKNGKVASETRL